MRYELKRTSADLVARRAEILAEYRWHGLEPIRIGREPISIELAVILGLLVDTRISAAPTHHPDPQEEAR